MDQPTQQSPAADPALAEPGNGNVAHNGNAADAFSRRLLEALVSFRDGDFTARLPNDHVWLHR